MDVIRSSWDFIPSRRPSFEKIARNIKRMRAECLNTFPSSDSPKPVPLLDQWGVHHPYHPHHSPDILPQPLLISATPLMDNLHNVEDSATHPGSALGLDIGPGAPDVLETGHTRSSSSSSVTLVSSATTVNLSVLASNYYGDEIAAKGQDERRYRMLLQHDYHTIRASYTPFRIVRSLTRMLRSDPPTLAAISRGTRCRGLFIET